MITQLSRAYLVTWTLTLSVLSTGIIPAATAHAASKGALHRSGTAAIHSNAPIATTADPVHATAALTSTTPVAQTATKTASTPSAATPTGTTAAHSPSGNNGFIKVNDEIIPDSTPNNDPHVSCRLKVEFYNYDHNPANRAQVTFSAHNPTAGNGYTLVATGNATPAIGGDAAGGGNDLDAVESYRLTFSGKPHDKQGYHVKLTIHADGSRGADVKHKVFWVQPCQGHVLSSSSSGHILATSTSRENPAALPAVLPSTGTNPYGFVITFLASALTYALTLGAGKFRGLRAQV